MIKNYLDDYDKNGESNTPIPGFLQLEEKANEKKKKQFIPTGASSTGHDVEPEKREKEDQIQSSE